MAGGVAHEINNPLAIIQGVVSIPKEKVDAGLVAANKADGCKKQLNSR